MSILPSKVLVMVTLPSGDPALYECDPQHVPREGVRDSSMFPIWFGRQIAHKRFDTWYKAGGWNEIEDPVCIKELERRREQL